MKLYSFITIFFISLSSLFAEVIDSANMFSASTVNQVNQNIKDFKSKTKKDFVFETVQNTNGLPSSEFALQKARQRKVNGIYVLISKQTRKIEIKVGSKTNQIFDSSKRAELKQTISASFKEGNFDNGLKSSVGYFYKTISGKNNNLAKYSSEKPKEAGFSWLTIGIIIIAILLVIRLVGSLFGNRNRGHNSDMQQQGGFGGNTGGSGIFGSILGGVFGAVAGSWMYDKFFGGNSGGLFANDSNPTSEDTSAGMGDSSMDDGQDYFGESGSWDSGSDFGDFGGDDFGGGDW